jgi:amino acid transporter
MGSMIGSGIFIVSADMMRNLGSGYWLIAVWVITGIMTVAAALSYGELSAMFPKAGGQYTYITGKQKPHQNCFILSLFVIWYSTKNELKGCLNADPRWKSTVRSNQN